MTEKKFVVPEVLAILPVRDTVLFPGAVLPLTVGRESSLALVNSLQGEEKLLINPEKITLAAPNQAKGKNAMLYFEPSGDSR